MMRRWLGAAAVVVTAACHSPASLPAVEQVSLYQYAGSKQCVGGGKALEVLLRELAGAGVNVVATRCGSDGREYAATCGAGDGAIFIVTVPASQAAAARRHGLKPLDELPGATALPCPPLDTPTGKR